MVAKILDGQELARRMVSELKPKVEVLIRERGRAPVLVILSAGGNPAARLYTRRQIKMCSEIGILARVEEFPERVSEAEFLRALEGFERDRGVDSILIETPLPDRFLLSQLLEGLPADKDVEGLTSANFGRLFSEKVFDQVQACRVFIPPTASAIVRLLLETEVAVRGAQAVVVGRSSVVGRPVGHLLSSLDATVTLCHSKTRRLSQHLKRADIVVTAVGHPHLVRGRDLKRGAVVLDAGISYEGKKICGDVDFDSARRVAGWITPVPGGVGPVTTAMLLANVVQAAQGHQRASRLRRRGS